MTTAGVIDSLARDARQAMRGLRRSPAFTLVALFTLAIGIGATTAVFSVVDGVLLKPLSYPKADELVALQHDAPGLSGLPGGAGVIGLTPSMLIAYRELNRSFASFGLYYQTGTNVIAGSEPEQVSMRLRERRLARDPRHAAAARPLDRDGRRGTWAAARGRLELRLLATPLRR